VVPIIVGRPRAPEPPHLRHDPQVRWIDETP
jgi:hypothetical protein